MEQAVTNYIQMCQWDSAKYLIFSNNVFGHLVYYSHLLPLLVALLLALFIFFQNRGALATRWFLFTNVLLVIWLFSDLVLWASEKPPLIMFFWSLLVLIEPMIYAGILLFMYAFIDGGDVSFKKKLIIFGLLLPTVLLTSTNFAVSTFDLTNCNREAIEGWLAFYGYGIEIVFALWILVLGMERFKRSVDKSAKTKIVLITAGAVFFLLSFAMGNVIGSLLVDWQIGQYGLFGIPVFVAILSYLIVKYHAFNVKLIATQILVVALWVLTLAILFLRNINTVQIVVGITLFLFTILGYLLIRSVKIEVRQREELSIANEGQATLIHFINHQIKGFLNKGRIAFNELLTEPEYGPVNEPAKKMLTDGENFMTEGVDFVQQILKATDIEKGTFTYDMQALDFGVVVRDVSSESQKTAEAKNLKYELKIADGDYKTTGDKSQLVEAVKNLITNSILYTPDGSIDVQLTKNNKQLLLTIKDTGIGLSDEVKNKLFTKGGRGADSVKINIDSTGYGLSIVKGIVEAHKGRVWAESAGTGKGSAFFLELPLA